VLLRISEWQRIFLVFGSAFNACGVFLEDGAESLFVKAQAKTVFLGEFYFILSQQPRITRIKRIFVVTAVSAASSQLSTF
jgi:hypothetical protein